MILRFILVLWMFFCCLLPSHGKAAATVTDLPTLAQQLLINFGPVPQTTTTVTQQPNFVCYMPPHHVGEPICGWVYHTVTTTKTSVQPLTATNLTFSTGNPKFSDPVKTTFPDQVTAWDTEELNCGSGSATVNVGFSEIVQHSSTIGLTQSVTNGSSFQTSFSSGSLIGVGGPSVTATLGFTNSQTSTQASTDLTSTSDTRTATASYTLPSKGAIVGMFEVWPIVFSLPFSITVTFDGDLSKNDKNYGRISEIIPAPLRTVVVSGVVQVTEASQGAVSWYEPPNFDPTTSCANRTGVEHAPYTPPAGAKLVTHGSNL